MRYNCNAISGNITRYRRTCIQFSLEKKADYILFNYNSFANFTINLFDATIVPLMGVVMF